jgi:hypothetical protein
VRRTLACAGARPYGPYGPRQPKYLTKYKTESLRALELVNNSDWYSQIRLICSIDVILGVIHVYTVYTAASGARVYTCTHRVHAAYTSA